jgi:hypothetical protein
MKLKYCYLDMKYCQHELRVMNNKYMLLMYVTHIVYRHTKQEQSQAENFDIT